MFCKKCGSQLLDNATFCGNCGTSLTEAPATAESPAAPVEAAPAAVEVAPATPAEVAPAAPAEAAPAPVEAPAAPVEAAPAPVEAPVAPAAPVEAAPAVPAAPVEAVPTAPVEAAPAAPAAPVAPVAAPAAPVAPKQKPKWLLPVIIGGAAFILVMIMTIVIVAIVANRDIKIDLNEFASFEYMGYDTVGEAKFKFDYDAFEEKYGKKLKFTKAGRVLYGDLEPVEAFQDVLSIYARNGRVIKNELKNGDEVEMVWKDALKTVMNESFKVEIVSDKLTGTVQGLEATTIADIFKDIELVYKGVAPYASVTVQASKNPYNLNFRVDVRNNLNNGDTITITTSRGENLNKYLIENYGVMAEATSKTYTVSGLASLIMKPEDIPGDMMTKLEESAKACNDARLAKDVTSSSEKLVSADYIGYYFLTNKSKSNSSTNNQMVFVFRNVVHNTYSYSRKTYSEDNVFYSFCTINNLTVLPDGTTSVDYSTMRMNTSNDVRFESNVGYKTWYYYGYTDLDSLKNQAITRNIDKYDYVEKIDQSVAGGSSKPAETKPAETQPSETQPSETQPSETQPSETQPSETTAAAA